MKKEKLVNLGYKYRLYPTKDQQQILNHQMFIYNQAYNICLNLWNKENNKNKKLPKVRLDAKILPKKLEIEFYNGKKYLDPLTFEFKKGQKVEEVFFTFAFGSPELFEEGLEVIEAKREALFDGIKEIVPFSKLQWANRAKIYKFIALQSKYEKHLQKTLKVNAKRNKTPRAIMAMMEKISDDKLVSSLDLRMVFNDVYGDINKTHSFNIMSGIFSAEAEAKVLPDGKGVYQHWETYSKAKLFLIHSQNKSEAIEQMQKAKISQRIIERLKQSKKNWLFPFEQTENIGWLEVDPTTYHTISVFENGQYSSMTETSILEQLTTGPTGYGFGMFAGVKTSITTLVSVKLWKDDVKEACALAETIASKIACAVGLIDVAAGIKRNGYQQGKDMDNIVIGGMGCTSILSNAGGGGRGGGIAAHLVSRTYTSILNGDALGFANGFADGVFLFFEVAKSNGGCK